jgi:multicomponent Na+:H+ antiporter subunit E
MTVSAAFRLVSAVAALFLFWLALSGYFTPFLLTAGFACAVAVALFARRMDVIDAEGHPVQLGWRIVLYWGWLSKEIAKSCWTVSKIIVNPSLPISPTIVRFRPGQKTNVGLAIHANSITLTPGTITIDATAQEFVVHALTRAGAEDALSGEMDRRVSATEGSR